MLALCGALTACGAGDGGGDGLAGDAVTCDSISGGGSTVTATGPAVESAKAADADLHSFGALRLTSTSPTGTLRATAQDGVVFPAGSRAGAFVSFLNQGSSNATIIRTYLEGVLVESGNPGSGFFDFTGGATSADFYTGFVTSAPFDAVEFSETDDGANGTAEYRVYEICSDGGVD